MKSEAAAAESRAAGMTEAVDHADRVELNWSERAFNLLLTFAQAATCPFLTEQVREFAEKRGLPEPPDARAWGSIMVRAAKAQRIVKVGFGLATSSNLSPKVLWDAA